MTPSRELSSALSAPSTIPLPTGSQQPTVETPTGKYLSIVLVLLVSVLAFLLASFPARNSDVWLHLARGRLLAHGEFPGTSAPDLAFDLWGNQNWLYDLGCYGCYQALGGAGLVLVKALLAAGIALLLLRQSRTSPGWCLPTVCTSLALMTMSLYLQLQPATVSYFLLALLLSVLGRPQADPATGPVLHWPLLLLLVVWANVDRGFLLGLGVVALVWLGEIVEVALSAGTAASRWRPLLLRRGFSFVVLTAACLLNPSGLGAFALAEEWGHFGSSAAPVTSPFTRAYFARVGWNPASLGYFLLLALSALSFAALGRQGRWRRFLPWVGLALLSVFQPRAIPCFAVVASPILAWNLQDLLARRLPHWSATLSKDEAQRSAAVLTALLIGVLLLCAWPGWLQAPPFGPRRWALDLPPAPERGAAAVRRWREEGKLPPDSAGLHLSAETVYAFAWFNPPEKRLRFTPQDSAIQWLRRMRSSAVDHVVVYDLDRERLSAALGGLLADPEQWPLLYQEGDLAVFGWRDPQREDSAELFRGWTLDLNRLAFHPSTARQAPPASERQAPAPAWWEAFWKAASPRSLDRGEALLHLLHAEAQQRVAPLRHLRGWENSQAAGLVGAAAAWPTPLALSDAPLRLVLFRPQLPEDGEPAQRAAPLDRLAMVLQRRYTLQQDDAPPALYYLAVRAAGRALAAEPDDATAQLLLGESYLGLLHATRERAWARSLPKLVQLRQAQASAALNRALALRPDFIPAHLHLARLYEEMGYLDLALQHLQTSGRLARDAGPPPGVTWQDFSAQLAQQEEQVQRLAHEVEKRENTATVQASNSSTRDRALAAFNNGLAGKALDLLLQSHLSAFGAEGMALELELLLGVGRAPDVHQWLRPEHERDLGGPSYHWVLARAWAATGDYRRAEAECEESARALATRPDQPAPMHLRENMALATTRLLMDGEVAYGASFANLRSFFSQAALMLQLRTLAHQMRQQAELAVLRGLLALEEGEIGQAQVAFRAALALWKDEATTAAGGGLDFNGRTLAQTCLRWCQ